MAELITVARPYAEASFRLARETGTLAAWSEALAVLSLVAQDPQAVALAHHPKFSLAQIQALLADILGPRATPQVGNFIAVVLESRRFALLPHVSELFEAMKAAEEGAVKAEIETAFPLDDSQLESLRTLMQTRLGRKVETTVRVEPELIGGVRMLIGDDVIDASVRGKLAAMSVSLSQ